MPEVSRTGSAIGGAGGAGAHLDGGAGGSATGGKTPSRSLSQAEAEWAAEEARPQAGRGLRNARPASASRESVGDGGVRRRVAAAVSPLRLAEPRLRRRHGRTVPNGDRVPRDSAAVC